MIISSPASPYQRGFDNICKGFSLLQENSLLKRIARIVYGLLECFLPLVNQLLYTIDVRFIWKKRVAALCLPQEKNSSLVPHLAKCESLPLHSQFKASLEQEKQTAEKKYPQKRSAILLAMAIGGLVIAGGFLLWKRFVAAIPVLPLPVPSLSINLTPSITELPNTPTSDLPNLDLELITKPDKQPIPIEVKATENQPDEPTCVGTMRQVCAIIAIVCTIVKILHQNISHKQKKLSIAIPSTKPTNNSTPLSFLPVVPYTPHQLPSFVQTSPTISHLRSYSLSSLSSISGAEPSTPPPPLPSSPSPSPRQQPDFLTHSGPPAPLLENLPQSATSLTSLPTPPPISKDPAVSSLTANNTTGSLLPSVPIQQPESPALLRPPAPLLGDLPRSATLFATAQSLSSLPSIPEGSAVSSLAPSPPSTQPSATASASVDKTLLSLSPEWKKVQDPTPNHENRTYFIHEKHLQEWRSLAKREKNDAYESLPVIEKDEEQFAETKRKLLFLSNGEIKMVFNKERMKDQKFFGSFKTFSRGIDIDTGEVIGAASTVVHTQEQRKMIEDEIDCFETFKDDPDVCQLKKVILYTSKEKIRTVEGKRRDEKEEKITKGTLQKVDKYLLLLQYGNMGDALSCKEVLSLENQLFLADRWIKMVKKKHQQKFLLRDIKPANIILYKDPSKSNIDCFFSDLGAFCKQEDKKKKNQVAGTIYYMSPEYQRAIEKDRYNLEKYTTQANDLWQLGVSIYDAFTNHEGSFPTHAEINSQLSKDDYYLDKYIEEKIKIPNSQIKKIVCDFLSGILKIDPNERKVDLNAFQEALELNKKLKKGLKKIFSSMSQLGKAKEKQNKKVVISPKALECK